MFSTRIRPPHLYIWEDHGQLSSHQSNRPTNQSTTSLLSSLPLYFSSFFVGATWTMDQQRWSSRVARLARAAHSRRTPRRGLSRACGVSGLKRPCQRVLRITLLARLLLRHVLRITLIAGGIRFRCGHPLGVGRPKKRLGFTLSDLTPYRVCDLI